MLLDFTVENYRSIKGAETLSAVAQKTRGAKSTQETTQEASNGNRRKDDRDITPGYPVPGWNLDILPVIAIFGANASGKSNIVQAMDYLISLMRYTSSGNGYQPVFYAKPTPFRLDKTTVNSPVKFELRTVFGKFIYTYSLALSQKRILSEKLDYSLESSKRSRKLFHRVWNEASQQFDWMNGPDFKGPHLQLTKSLKETESFMSLLFRLETKVINSLMAWLGIWLPGTGFLPIDQDREYSAARNFGYESPEALRTTVDMIRKFDTGIADIQIELSEESDDNHEVYAIHGTENGPMRWRFEEESAGTQRLFDILFRIQVALEVGSLMIVDELGASLHPHIVQTIVRLFQNPKTNPKRAQLIFTSHDNTLQRNHLLRRDQIWFTQKRPDHSTALYPLTDFKVRNDLAIDKAYLDGRFGAVPILPSDEAAFLTSADQCLKNFTVVRPSRNH